MGNKKGKKKEREKKKREREKNSSSAKTNQLAHGLSVSSETRKDRE